MVKTICNPIIWGSDGFWMDINKWVTSPGYTMAFRLGIKEQWKIEPWGLGTRPLDAKRRAQAEICQACYALLISALGLYKEDFTAEKKLVYPLVN